MPPCPLCSIGSPSYFSLVSTPLFMIRLRLSTAVLAMLRHSCCPVRAEAQLSLPCPLHFIGSLPLSLPLSPSYLRIKSASSSFAIAGSEVHAKWTEGGMREKKSSEARAVFFFFWEVGALPAVITAGAPHLLFMILRLCLNTTVQAGVLDPLWVCIIISWSSSYSPALQ